MYKAIGNVTFSHWSARSKPVYIKTNILSLPKLFEFETAKFVYFYKLNLLPKIFDNQFLFSKFCHSRTTKISIQNNLSISLFKTEQTQRSITYMYDKKFRILLVIT